MGITHKQQGREVFYGGNTGAENNAVMALVDADELDRLEGDYALAVERVETLEAALRRAMGEGYGIYKSLMDALHPDHQEW